MKGYGFLCFAEYMGKNIRKTVSKTLSGKHSQKLMHHAQQSATDALKTASKRAIGKAEEITGNMIGQKMVDPVAKSLDDKITSTASQSNPGTDL